ncbi:hypothetical protein Dip518_000642 [Parelusimicrobium proximum]|uniref:metallophosphoesterase n=1 Tax=Parelusimicrobium proximum TaxID=3228953 RepID=UPI003D164C35
MFFIILFSAAALHAYLPWRLGGLLNLGVKWPLYILFAAAFLTALTAMPMITKYDKSFTDAFYNIGAAWLGIFAYLTCVMIVFEAVNIFCKFPKPAAGWIVIGLAAVLGVYSAVNAFSFNTADIKIPVKNLQKEVRIMQISDVHLGAARGEKYLEKIVEKTNALKPDLVVITGDIADSKSAVSKKMFAPLKSLQAPAYFVTGNHDVYVDLDGIIARLRENNVRVMQNEVLVVNGIKLIGLNYMKADDSVYDPHQVSDETIKDTLPALDLSGDLPKIALHHGPWGVEYMNEYGIDVVLAGHTHAGQIFPATIFAKKQFPYNKGLADYKGTRIYVSQGAGTFLPKMRLGTNNEITLITLIPHN